jgi:hypothetical protein
LCGAPRKVSTAHCCDSKQFRVGLGDLLSEKMVKRDLVLCELLNEDVGFFVDLNLGLKLLCLSCALAFTCFTTAIYLLIEHILCWIFIGQCIFSGVDLACDYSSCSLVGRLSYSAFHNPIML